jgi:UDP-N-acetylmuramoyl-tripeptide--D-alanyl-D-alanine ligase
MVFDKRFVESVIPTVNIVHDSFPEDISCAVDSRSILPGEIFVALEGERVDGHAFVEHVLTKKDAGGAIIRADKIACLKNISPEILSRKAIIVVEDPLTALQDLAAAWRAQFDYPVLGITGSVGKTTTRELIKTILQQAGKSVISSVQNQNSLVGLPLNMFRMRAHHDIAVFELGISKNGEMARLVEILKPTIGLITGVAHCHLAGLGTLSGVAAEKRELFKLFGQTNIGIINGDQELLASVGYSHPVLKFGIKMTNQIQARRIQIKDDKLTFILKLYNKKYTISLDTNHAGSVLNVLAAAAAGVLFGVDDRTIVQAIQAPLLIAGRYQRMHLKKFQGFIINDCYNANPESVKAALVAFDKIQTPYRKIVVLGDMLELGVESDFWHRQIGRFLKKTPSIRQVIYVGSYVQFTQATTPHTIKSELVPSTVHAVERLRELLIEGPAAIFVKGSHGMQLEALIDAFADHSVNISAAKRIDVSQQPSVDTSVSPAVYHGVR